MNTPTHTKQQQRLTFVGFCKEKICFLGCGKVRNAITGVKKNWPVG